MDEQAADGTLAAVRAASVAEVAWRDPDRHRAGGLRVRGVVPLVGPRGPVLALPYAAARTARSIAAAEQVLLTVTEPRATGPAYRPLLLRCRPEVTEDRDGDRFSAELLDQELRRYPPSRVYADSPLLRREHWWWLPRLLVDLTVVATEPFASRSGEEDHLLVVSAEDGDLDSAIARVTGPTSAPVVDLRHGTPGPGDAVLFGQRASEDMERWGQWSWTGHWDGAALRVTDAPDTTGLPRTPGVLARWRRERDLERACRAGLALATGVNGADG